MQPRRGRRRRPAGRIRTPDRHPGLRGPWLGAGRGRPRAGGARAACAVCPRGPSRSRRDDTRWSWRSIRRPERLLADLIATGASLVSLNPLRDTLEDFFVRRVAEAGAGARADAQARGPVRAVSWVAVSVFRESVRDRVPYNLVLFAVLLIALVVPARPAHRRSGRQDHQGPRARRDRGVRPVHRDLHRHRAGLEGGRAAQHLLAARRSRSAARSSSPGKYAGLVLTLAVNVAVMTVALYAVLGYMTWMESAEFKSAWDAPGMDPAAAAGDLPHLRRADARHGGRALLLDVLDAAAVGGADLRPLHRRPLQHRAAELRSGGQLAAGGLAGARRSTMCCPTCPPSTSRRRSSTDCRSSAGYVLWTTGYGAAYIAALLLAATFIFSRRDFK